MCIIHILCPRKWTVTTFSSRELTHVPVESFLPPSASPKTSGVLSVISLSCAESSSQSAVLKSRPLCAGCEEYRFLHEGVCVLDCPERFFQDKELRECLPCHPDCALCDGPDLNDCDACLEPGATLQDGACLGACPPHNYRDSVTGECKGTV